jgi:hypothetical protein
MCISELSVNETESATEPEKKNVSPFMKVLKHRLQYYFSD